MQAAPIQQEEFARLMADCGLTPGEGPVAVAVSGGADSLALSFLAAEWGAAHFLTFDHKLRPESRKESERVSAWLGDCDHHILTWKEPIASGNLQAEARKARYTALESWCVENDVKTLLLAHHQDDQAETFLLRLARGSGADGLAAMDKVSPALTRQDGPALVRPMLEIPKARLIATLKARGQDWIDDPSNDNPDFDRVKIRNFLKNPPLDGFSPARLAATTGRMHRVRDSLERITMEILQEAVMVFPEGYASLEARALNRFGDETGLRALARILMHIGGNAYPPRLRALEQVYESVRTAGPLGHTLAGCLIQQDKGPVLIMREPAETEGPKPVSAGETVHWDERFEIRVGGENKKADYRIAALGENGWNSFRVEHPDHADNAGRLPHPVRLSLPAVWRAETLIAVPTLDYGEGFSVHFSPHTPLLPPKK